MIENKPERKLIWDYLLSIGCTEYGAAGMMGNMYAESGLIANRLEILCRKRLREAGKGEWSDEAYTAAVDNGTITADEFLHPLPGKQYGYGLCQWTSPGRKAALYNLAHSKGASIGDVQVQMELLKSELENTYKKTFAVLKSAKDIATASDYVLIHFEAPANADAAKATRQDYATEIYNLYHGGVKMTMAEQRQQVVNYLVALKGIKEGSAEHKALLKVFNDSGLCKRYKMTVYDAWCATAASAAYIAAGLGSIFPVECSCWYMIQIAKQRGIWVENDAYVPSIGDAVLYDWDDSGAGDNQGNPDHVGLVYSISGSTMQIIEGNKNNTVGIRSLQVNSRYIRGYVTPKFTGEGAASKTDNPVVPASGTTLNRNVKWTGVVTADELNVRTWGGVENATCSFSPLKENTEIGVCDSVKASDGSVWYYIKYNGKYGFVHSGWVKQKTSTNVSTGTKVTATDYAQKLDKSIAGTYKTTDDLNMRHGAGTGKGVMVVIPKGTSVQNYGYYSLDKGTKWLYVQVTYKGVQYTGFCSGKYLQK